MPSMSYLVYIMECKDGSLYTGITTDLKRRFRQHANQKGGAYTRAHAVSKIVYTEKFLTRSSAQQRESEIKSWRKERKLNLIESNKPKG